MERDFLPQDVNALKNMSSNARDKINAQRSAWEERLFDYWCKNNKSFSYRVMYGKQRGKNNFGNDAASSWAEYFARAINNNRYLNSSLYNYIKEMVDKDPYCLPRLSYKQYRAYEQKRQQQQKQQQNV